MQAPQSRQFLSDVPVFARFEDVADLSRYRALPQGWSLAVADVVASGAAIAAGKYKMVNMAGASVITAVLNALGDNGYPFVFGGDGAAIAVPPEGEEAVRAALGAVACWIAEELGLQMRTALVPIAAVRAAGLDVLVARHQASADLSFAMFAAGGSAWAEAEMKRGAFGVEIAPPGSKPDLTGLSCRWNPVQSRNGQIVSIIAVPGAQGVSDEFRALVADVVDLANAESAAGNPIPEGGPRPKLHFGGVPAEARAQAPRGKRLMAGLKVAFEITMTVLMHRTNLTLGGFNARHYARDVARNSDFRKYDDGLKMTVDVDDARLAKIEARLEEAARTGVCRFGVHRQASALVTCIVPSILTQDHIHFIDGAEGGYAEAARQMKAKAAS